MTETTINLPFISVSRRPLHLEEKLTRTEFERMTADLVDSCKDLRAGDRGLGGKTPSAIDHVIPGGWIDTMPTIQDLVKDLTAARTRTRV